MLLLLWLSQIICVFNTDQKLSPTLAFYLGKRTYWWPLVHDRLWTYIAFITPAQGGFRQKMRSNPRSSDVSLDQPVSDRGDLHTSHKNTFTRLSSSTKPPNKIVEGNTAFKLRLRLSGLTQLWHQIQAFNSYGIHKWIRNWLGRKR